MMFFNRTFYFLFITLLLIYLTVHVESAGTGTNRNQWIRHPGITEPYPLRGSVPQSPAGSASQSQGHPPRSASPP
ncbi:unnamed protein product [Rotaria socialis]|uniref:Uncharacterized protein n=1 Tax=Rotaria socialis TaxID=392032 RepID=A0A818NLJ6_9BILA|nr:unnamed protein product [Rotaria socialis]CAF3759209.1 unnamed protein product [Rotaria socialis]CAF4443962.1 unnamed protein product [Rotaria socialis]CAF4667882.1 unnamed protein product [Rotaria socialis]